MAKTKRVEFEALECGQCFKRANSRNIWQKDNDNFGNGAQQINGKAAGHYEVIDYDELVRPVEVEITVKS